MYKFWIQAYSTYRGLFAWLNWPGYISGTVVQPFATVIMYAILGRFTSDPAVVLTYSLGITIYSMAFIILSGVTQSWQYDRTYGTISFLFVSTSSRTVNFLSRALLHIPNGLISGFIGLLASWLIVGLNFSAVNWPGFILVMIIISICITGFGQLLGVISIAVRDWIGIQSLANGLLLILCGAIIPLAVFPAFIQELSHFIPITNGLTAARQIFSGSPLQAVAGDILKEIAIALAYYILAYVGFQWFEKSARRNGTLERDAL
jgi:ABC-2 type transport system permease protein